MRLGIEGSCRCELSLFREAIGDLGWPFLKRVAGYRLKLESGRSDLSKYATKFDLVNVCGESRCVTIGSLGFDLVDHMSVVW